jgi:hypothetical protein
MKEINVPHCCQFIIPQLKHCCSATCTVSFSAINSRKILNLKQQQACKYDHIGSCTLAKVLGKNVSDGDDNSLDYVLAFATLVGVTQTGSFLFVSHHPRWPRQVQSRVAVTGIIKLHFANGNEA